MGTANPYPYPSTANEDVTARHRQPSQQSSVPFNRLPDNPNRNEVIVIPPNMQIAGRVSGTGRFTAKTDSDVLLESMAQDRAKAIEKEQQRQNVWGMKSISQPESFPELIGTGGTKAAAGEEGNVPHPLSLVHLQQKAAAQARKAADEAEVAKIKELEVRARRRKVALVESLVHAVNGGDRDRDRDRDPANWREQAAALEDRNFRQPLLSLLGDALGANVNEAVLFNVLYPQSLINMFRNNRADLIKVEQKMNMLISDAKMSSLQLKPMAKAQRDVVHWLAKYYFLRSNEYEPEPKRYVSIVKTPQSFIPSPLLSQASKDGTFVAPSMTTLSISGVSSGNLVPRIYLSLKNVQPPQHAVGDSSKFEAVIGSGIFTVAEVISHVKMLLKVDYALNSRVQGEGEEARAPFIHLPEAFKCSQTSANTIEFEFRSLKAASDAYKTLMASLYPVFSLAKAGLDHRDQVSFQLSQYFDLVPGFQEEALAVAEQASSNVLHRDSLPTAAASVSATFTGFDESFSAQGVYVPSGGWQSVLPSKRGGAAAKMMASVQTLPSHLPTSSAAEATEDPSCERRMLDEDFLESLRLQEEWDQFLSTKRESTLPSSLYDASKVAEKASEDVPTAMAVVFGEDVAAVRSRERSEQERVSQGRGVENVYSVLELEEFDEEVDDVSDQGAEETSGQEEWEIWEDGLDDFHDDEGAEEVTDYVDRAVETVNAMG